MSIKNKICTLALNTSIEKPLKQFMTAWCTSSPRLSNAFIVENIISDLWLQDTWMSTVPPSLSLTSTYEFHLIKNSNLFKMKRELFAEILCSILMSKLVHIRIHIIVTIARSYMQFLILVINLKSNGLN
jgi:hypothetical protein